jgi:hypothetical protein
MKKIMARETILAYPNFEIPFKVHTDASAYQLGAVISQNGKPIVFYSRKLTPTQTQYTTTERELLPIVKTLKEFLTILLGQQLIIKNDNENLAYKHFNLDRIMQWRLYIEEYSPDLRYIKGTKNVAADALSRLGIHNNPMNEAHFTEALSSELYTFDDEDLPATAFPLSCAFLGKAQSTDVAILKEAAKTKSLYSIQPFTGGGKTRELICYNGKIVVPKKLQARVIQWYHNYLGHPGINRTKETIGQHLWWPKMRNQITNSFTVCSTCQLNKRRPSKTFGHLPEKEAEAIPWGKMRIDLIGIHHSQKRTEKPYMQVCHHDRSRNQLVRNPPVRWQTSNHCCKHRRRGMVFQIPLANTSQF